MHGRLSPQPSSDKMPGIWRLLNLSICEVGEVACPKPHHTRSAPLIADRFNILCAKTKGVLSAHRAESIGMLDVFLSHDDLEWGSGPSDHAGFICGSPPKRANNPLIHDPTFKEEMALLASPSLENPLGAGLEVDRARKAAPLPPPLGVSDAQRPTAAKMESSAAPCRGSSSSGNPKIRIEGFAARSAESSHAIHVLACSS